MAMTVVRLLTGVVQVDVEVLEVAGCHRVGRDVDGWLSVLEDRRDCAIRKWMRCSTKWSCTLFRGDGDLDGLGCGAAGR